MSATDPERPAAAEAPAPPGPDEPGAPAQGIAVGERLRGQRVLVMRPAHQIAATAALLQAEGAETIALPSITIVPPPDPARVARAVGELDRYAVVVLTSENAVEALWQAMVAQSRDGSSFGGARIAAIGRGTAEALRRHGLRVDILPERFVAEELAAAILTALGERAVGARVLLPRALEAREVLPDTLRAAGVEVEVVPVYQTLPAPAARAAELAAELRAGRIEYVLLCSGSTISSLSSMLGREARALLAHTKLCSIGPITTESARQLGHEVAVTAPSSTTESLVEAIAAHAAATRG